MVQEVWQFSQTDRGRDTQGDLSWADDSKTKTARFSFLPMTHILIR